MNNSEIAWSEEQTRPHCPLISGTFGVRIGGVDIGLTYDGATGQFSNTDLPYYLSASNLQSALRNVVGWERVEV